MYFPLFEPRGWGKRSAVQPQTNESVFPLGGALFKLFYGVGERGIGHMDIAIHGGFDARMTEQPLQDFRHDPAFNRASGIGVPLLVAGCQHIVCPVRQGNGSVAAS